MSIEGSITVERSATHGSQVAIVGIGGAGNNLLSHAINGGVSPKNCVAVNTDPGQLSESPAQNKVFLGDRNWTVGPSSGQALSAVSLFAQRVVSFTRESNFTILLTGLGGVTGTRTAPIVAQLHRSHYRPVVAVVALPFIHERGRRFVALRGLRKMVEACDCTVVIDNAVQKQTLYNSERVADETSTIAVRGLSDVVQMGNPEINRKVLHVLSLGAVATVCTAIVESSERVESRVIDALRTPSASLPLARAKGAVVLYHGHVELSAVEAHRVYETITSLVGHGLEFVQVNTQCGTIPRVSIFLSGYTYGETLGTFVDLIEDMYDVEYGLEASSADVGLEMPLYQMEVF